MLKARMTLWMQKDRDKLFYALPALKEKNRKNRANWSPIVVGVTCCLRLLSSRSLKFLPNKAEMMYDIVEGENDDTASNLYKANKKGRVSC